MSKTKKLTHFTLFATLIIVLSLTPLGFIHLGLIKATLIHVPVIVGSLILGKRMGMGLGFIFGCMSLLNNTLTPSILSFAFSPLIPVIGTSQGSLWALVICFLPRILVGYVPAFYLEHRGEATTRSLGFSAFLGSMTNTLLVMGFILVLFKNAYASARGIEISAVTTTILSVIFINGIPEAIVATALSVPIVKALTRINRHS